MKDVLVRFSVRGKEGVVIFVRVFVLRGYRDHFGRNLKWNVYSKPVGDN